MLIMFEVRDIIKSCGLKGRKRTYSPLKYYQLAKDNKEKGEYVLWTSVAKNHNLLKRKLPGQFLNRWQEKVQGKCLP